MDTSKSPFTITKNQENLDFSHYFRLIMHNKWKIILFAALVTSIAVFFVKPLPAIYEAESTLMIEFNHPSLVGVQNIHANTQSREYQATQYEIIRSRALAEKVIDRLDLVSHSVFVPKEKKLYEKWVDDIKQRISGEDPGPEEQMTGISKRVLLRIFDRNLTVEPVAGTQLLNIRFQATDPQLAADVVNTMVEVYIESYLEARLDITQKATTWLNDRLVELRDKLQESEERLQNYKESERMIGSGGEGTLVNAELTQLQQNFIAARDERTRAEALYNQVRSAGRSQSKLLSIPQISDNALVQASISRLTVVDQRIAELKGRYGQKAPQMVAASAEQAQVQRDLTNNLTTASRGIEISYRRVLQTENDIKLQIEKARDRLQLIEQKEGTLSKLEREVQTNQQIYDVFLGRGRQAEQSGRLEDPPARIVDRALAPTRSIGPNKEKYIIAAAVLAIALSVALILLLDFLNATVRSTDDVEFRLHAPLLGFLPLLKRRKQAFNAFDEDNDKDGFSESVRTIRTGLILSSLDNPFKVLVVSSSVPNEGKSTVSLNLAGALGQMEKVLLIDADMRRPSLGSCLDLAPSTLGLSDIIMGNADIDACVHHIPESQIDVITAGTVPKNPLELLSSQKFKDLLEMYRGRYDRIVIDSAPVHVVSDAKVLSSYADSLVYVVRANATPISVATRGLNMLRSVEAPLAGVVLNQVNMKKAGQYDTYYSVYKENYNYVNKT